MQGEVSAQATVATVASTPMLARLAQRVVVVGVGLAFLLVAYGKMGGQADDTVAQGNLAAILPFVHEYALDHGGYAGMTLAALRQGYSLSLDPQDYRVVDQGAGDFCVQSTYAGRTWHVSGSQGKPLPGSCQPPS